MLEKWHEFHKIARDAFKVNNLWCFYQTLLVMQFHFDGIIVKCCFSTNKNYCPKSIFQKLS